MSYSKQTWVNNVSDIDEEKMNHIEDGIYDNSLDIESLDENLDNANEEIEKVKTQLADQNIITIGLNADVSITSTQQFQNTTIDLTKEMVKIGTKLSLSNGKVLIGEGVSHILVSANMQTQGDNLTYGLIILKNNEEVAKNYGKPENTTYHSIAISPIPIEVNEGDIIKMAIYINNNNSTKNIRAYDGIATYLTVEVIN